MHRRIERQPGKAASQANDEEEWMGLQCILFPRSLLVVVVVVDSWLYWQVHFVAQLS